MTLYRSFLKNTRPWMLATAAGVSLCSTRAELFAQAPGMATVTPAAVSQSEPRRLSDSNQAARAIEPAAMTTAQPASPPKSEVQRQLELLYEQKGQPMPEMPRLDMSKPANTPAAVKAAGGTAQTGRNATMHTMTPEASRTTAAAATQPPADTSILSKMSKAFRINRAGKAPPVDPGMSYPTASQQPNNMVPGVSSPQIPAVPPVISSTPGGTGAPPAIFHPPASAIPIATNSAPPVAQPKNIDQLKTMLHDNGQQHQMVQNMVPPPEAGPAIPAVPPVPGVQQQQLPVGNPNLPLLDFNAPLPQQNVAVAPAEPTAPKAAQPAMAANDPLNNLFPEDDDDDDDEKLVDAPVTQPYTGLKLEEDLFVQQNNKPAGNGVITVKPAAQPTITVQAAPQAQPQLQLQLQPSQQPQVRLQPVAPPALQPQVTPQIQIAAQPGVSLNAPEPPTAAPELKEIKTAQQPQMTMAPQMPMLELGRPNTQININVPPPAEPAQANVAPAKAPASDAGNPQSKMERIAARKDLPGLKGFCPVVLRDHRDLVDSNPAFSVIYNGKRYEFSSVAAMETFLHEPTKYAPAAAGNDVIHLALTGEPQAGSLEHAVWYKGRLYLFSGVETMETFVAAPSGHATED
ncbi:hypothetical protein [Planctomicrobium sp. SH664]|uniref:hypothetical protein n=1 Tax=Planctomicrobium sp. SH664 TaxID=3448125 RepID=UPI003F5AFFC5